MEQVFRVQAEPLIKAIVETLKANTSIELPKNHDLIKTGHGREYSPQQPDWFYVRMAAIVRIAMRNGTVSLRGLSGKFGNRKNRGVRPSSFAGASYYVNGFAVSQLENINWFNFADKKNILTSTAKEILGDIMEKISQK